MPAVTPSVEMLVRHFTFCSSFHVRAFEATCCCRMQGPIENLKDHLSDPAAVNAFNYATKFTPSN